LLVGVVDRVVGGVGGGDFVKDRRRGERVGGLGLKGANTWVCSSSIASLVLVLCLFFFTALAVASTCTEEEEAAVAELTLTVFLVTATLTSSLFRGRFAATSSLASLRYSLYRFWCVVVRVGGREGGGGRRVDM